MVYDFVMVSKEIGKSGIITIVEHGLDETRMIQVMEDYGPEYWKLPEVNDCVVFVADPLAIKAETITHLIVYGVESGEKS